MRYRTLGRTGIQVSPYALGALKERRDEVVLATKFGRPAGQGPNQ
jgi:aryl-alcohol dehydrogenase-like predicted oxidoreductase